MYKYLSMFIIITVAFFSDNSFAKQPTLIEFGNNPGELSASYFQATKYDNHG